MMSGYSKMSKSIGNSHSSSKSADFNPHNSPPFPQQQQKPITTSFPNKSPLPEEELAATAARERQPQLRRNSSVSSAANRAKKRALSFSTMRRSASVSERYCRIHDQSEFLADVDDHDHVDVDGGDGYGKIESMPETATADRASSRSDQKKKLTSRSRIIRVCKKILGL